MGRLRTCHSTVRATPTSVGATGGRAMRLVRVISDTSNPAASSAVPVSRSTRQPPARCGQAGPTALWSPRSQVPGSARTCSSTCRVPPGRSTRRISASDALGSSTEHRTYATRTESTESSARGICSAGASIRSTWTPASARARTRARAASRMDALGSRATTDVTASGRCSRSCPGPRPTTSSRPRASASTRPRRSPRPVRSPAAAMTR